MGKRNQRVEASERQLLNDLQKLASRTYVYENFWCGKVPFDGKLTELQTGPPVPFAELTWRDQADVLREFIHWDHYPARAWDDEYKISENITAGKPLEQWLERTSIRQSFQLLAEGKSPPPPTQCPEITQRDVANALAEVGVSRSLAKADEGSISLRDLRDGSQKQERNEEDQKSKSHDLER